ncbi:MAG: cation:proton antiporter regulatory subunit, partial [Halodesulfurarchaeum sp.]
KPGIMLKTTRAVLIVAIQRGEDIITSPGPDTRIEPEDTLVVIGTQEDVLAFESLIANKTDNQ